MDLQLRRDISHQVFGNKYALEVGAAISRYPKNRFTQKDIARVLGIDPNLVKTYLDKLKNSGLVVAHAKEGLEVPCTKEPSQMWKYYEGLEAELELA
jgi:Mn-dependent DtxR family transcriptional regulator